MSRAVGASVAALLLLLGCGRETPHSLPPEGERVPITPRAVAAIMLDHLPADTTARQATYTDRDDEPGTLGADLRYDGDGESDGDLVRVVLAPGQLDLECDGRCEELETDVADATMTLRWDVETPEEDPGTIAVVLQRADEHLYVYQGGPVVTGDPRDQELAISVDDMVAVAEDPWLRLETSPEAVAAGERLEQWDGG